MKPHLARKRPPLHALALALSLGAATLCIPGQAQAGPIDPRIRFSTTGTIHDSRHVQGTPVVSFQGNPGASATGSEGLSHLGEFLVAALPDGVSTHYDRTGFAIGLSISEVNGNRVPTVDDPLWLTGELDGTVTGSDFSDLSITFRSVIDYVPPDILVFIDRFSAPTFQTHGTQVSLILPSESLSLGSSATNGGRTPLLGTLNVTPVPEPTSLLVFTLAALGCGFLRKRRMCQVQR